MADEGYVSISDLPEPIIHRVMASLTAEDVARIPVLSRRFRSLWSSFPVLDFDQEAFAKRELGPGSGMTANEANRFLEYVSDSIQLRRLNTVLEKFRLRVDLVDITSDSRVDEIILFALENSVLELDIEILHAHQQIFIPLRYKMMEGFSSSSITVLKLNGIQFNLDMLISSCPSVENLILCHCSVSDNPSINIASARSLRMLSFTWVNITDKWIGERVSMFVNLEILLVTACGELRNLKVSNAKLERLDIVDHLVLESIELVAPNLRSLYLANNACVTDHWLKAQVSSMNYLENLKLEGFRMLRRVEIFNDRLRSLKLLDCANVVELAVDAIKLQTFIYSGEVITFKLMNSPRLRNPTLALKQTYGIVTIPQWNSLRSLLSFFSHCEALTLVCRSTEEFIIPEEIRNSRFPPLYDVKHLKIKNSCFTGIKAELVDNILWLSPHPESLCFVPMSRKEKIIKFYYQEETESREEICCRGLPLPCWRDDLKNVDLLNFEASDEQDQLLTYFGESAKILEAL